MFSFQFFSVSTMGQTDGGNTLFPCLPFWRQVLLVFSCMALPGPQCCFHCSTIGGAKVLRPLFPHKRNNSHYVSSHLRGIIYFRPFMVSSWIILEESGSSQIRPEIILNGSHKDKSKFLRANSSFGEAMLEFWSQILKILIIKAHPNFNSPYVLDSWLCGKF